MIKSTIILFLIHFSCNAQPLPEIQEFARKKKMRINKEKTKKYPDSLELHYNLFYNYFELGMRQKAMQKIDFLILKKPDNNGYKQCKLQNLVFSRSGGNNEEAYQYYVKNLKFTLTNCQKKYWLTSIGKSYEWDQKYDEAILFFDKALKIQEGEERYCKNNYILDKKREVYHQQKKYKKVHEIMMRKHFYGVSSPEYRTNYLKEYKKSIKELYPFLKKNCGFTVKNNKYYIYKKNFSRSSSNRIILELAYNYYKIGNLERSLTLLHILTENSFGYSTRHYYKYWCMYLALYKKYKNKDYRVHLLLAGRYFGNNFSHKAFFSDDARYTNNYFLECCDPHDFMKIPKDVSSFDEENLHIRNLSLKEIKIAEKLTGKKFKLHRIQGLFRIKNINKIKVIFESLLKNKPNDLKVISMFCSYYDYLNINAFDKSKESYRKKLEKLKKECKEQIIIDGN